MFAQLHNMILKIFANKLNEIRPSVMAEQPATKGGRGGGTRIFAIVK